MSTYGLAAYLNSTEVLFTQKLIYLYYSVEFRYPPLPAEGESTVSPTVLVFDLPETEVNAGGTIGWMTTSMRPADRIFDLGGNQSGETGGYTYTGTISGITLDNNTVTVTINTVFGDPSEFQKINFFKR